jgi:hypothetical protein
LVDDSTTGETKRSDLRLSMAINGFIVHPAVGDFHADVDLRSYRRNGGFETDQVGFGAEVNLLPQGKYTANLFARRELFDVSTGSGELLPSLVNFPDTLTTWGGRFLARRGPFQGVLLGFNGGKTEPLGVGLDGQQTGRQFVDYSRAGRNFRHKFRLEHREDDLRDLDLNLQDTTATIEETGKLSPKWSLQLTGIGIVRDVETRESQSSTDFYRLRTNFTRDFRQVDYLTIQTMMGTVRSESGANADSYSLALFYGWRASLVWTVTPFVRYAESSSSDDVTQDSRRAGLTATWEKRRGEIDALVSTSVGYNASGTTVPTMTRNDSRSAFGSVSGSIGHGDSHALRKDVEFQLSWNELRLTRDPLSDLPDLGVSTSGLTTQNTMRARATLLHRWDSQSISGWGEWRRSNSSDDVAGNPGFEADMLTATMQYSAFQFGFTANIATTSVDDGVSLSQEVDSRGLQAFWRPWRSLEFIGSYREDERRLILSPDLDSYRFDLGAKWNLGLFTARISVYESDSQFCRLAARCLRIPAPRRDPLNATGDGNRDSLRDREQLETNSVACVAAEFDGCLGSLRVPRGWSERGRRIDGSATRRPTCRAGACHRRECCRQEKVDPMGHRRAKNIGPFRATLWNCLGGRRSLGHRPWARARRACRPARQGQDVARGRLRDPHGHRDLQPMERRDGLGVGRGGLYRQKSQACGQTRRELDPTYGCRLHRKQHIRGRDRAPSDSRLSAEDQIGPRLEAVV